MSITSYTISEPTRSCIFLNDVSVVDHAYIDDKGCVVGGSFNPCFEVSGTPDPVEKVVVDFSSIKKDIKQMIDAHTFNPSDNGFDHKVWVIEGYSNISSIHRYVLTSDSQMIINTPSLTLELPSDAVKRILAVDGMIPNYDNAYIGAAFEQYLQPLLEQKYPNVNIAVKCYNTTNIHVPTDNLQSHAKPFRYVHGLKDSTSYGCKNIAHGHGSFITADRNPDNVLQDIANELDNTVFVRSDNIQTFSSRAEIVDTMTIHYTTPRGDFTMILDTDSHNIVILNTETTVEYLAQYVKTRYGAQMKDLGITYFCISEGLSKGAVETL